MDASITKESPDLGANVISMQQCQWWLFPLYNTSIRSRGIILNISITRGKCNLSYLSSVQQEYSHLWAILGAVCQMLQFLQCQPVSRGLPPPFANLGHNYFPLVFAVSHSHHWLPMRYSVLYLGHVPKHDTCACVTHVPFVVFSNPEVYKLRLWLSLIRNHS